MNMITQKIQKNIGKYKVQKYSKKSTSFFDKITKNLISRYIERTFTSQIKSQYLENIRTHYLDNEVLDIDKLLKDLKTIYH